jgi:hypothetical protein
MDGKKKSLLVIIIWIWSKRKKYYSDWRWSATYLQNFDIKNCNIFKVSIFTLSFREISGACGQSINIPEYLIFLSTRRLRAYIRTQTSAGLFNRRAEEGRTERRRRRKKKIFLAGRKNYSPVSSMTQQKRKPYQFAAGFNRYGANVMVPIFSNLSHFWGKKLGNNDSLIMVPIFSNLSHFWGKKIG